MFTCVIRHYVLSVKLLVAKPFGGRWHRRWRDDARRFQWRNVPVMAEFGGRVRDSEATL